MRTLIAPAVALGLLLVAGRASAQQPIPLQPQQAEEVKGKAEDPGYPFTNAWHGGFARSHWGRPVAVVVPPVSTYQTIWSWGTSSTQIVPIYPQYVGPSTGYPYDAARYYTPTPYWPNDTRQFGVYYIRGPW